MRENAIGETQAAQKSNVFILPLGDFQSPPAPELNADFSWNVYYFLHNISLQVVSETLRLFLCSSLPSFFSMGINGFSTLESVFVPAPLQTKYVNPVQVEYKNNATGISFSFIRKFNNYCYCCSISHRATLEILKLLFQLVLRPLCISQTV